MFGFSPQTKQLACSAVGPSSVFHQSALDRWSRLKRRTGEDVDLHSTFRRPRPLPESGCAVGHGLVLLQHSVEQVAGAGATSAQREQEHDTRCKESRGGGKLPTPGREDCRAGLSKDEDLKIRPI